MVSNGYFHRRIDRMDAIIRDYRQSHLSKGSDYDADFQRLPRRMLSWKIEQSILRKIVARFLPDRTIEYLDFACGTGRILAELENCVTTSTGIDISGSMLEVAKSRTLRSRILQADITRDRVLEGLEFDLITAFRFFPNAQSQLRHEVLGGLACRLKKSGILVFNNHRSTTFSRNRVARVVTRGSRGNSGMSPEEVHRLVASKGLEIVATYHVGIVPESETRPFWPRWIIQMVEEAGSRLPLATFARNLIYVCRHSS